MRSDKELEEESWEHDNIHYIGPQSGWIFKRGKEKTGKKGAGDLGGFYQHETAPVRVFYKQDPDIVKNMSEFAASRVMRRIAERSGNADCVARVELARVMTDSLLSVLFCASPIIFEISPMKFYKVRSLIWL